MCGISGIVDLGGGRSHEDLAAAALSMARILAHRGPDAEGVWTDEKGGAALGHRRLSIIDLSPAGAQPMATADGRWVVTYNGELYNFPELRTELEGLGCAFRGGSDTEVLLAAVARWGVEAALKRFVGMFALGLWDRTERTLYLARDRMGEKPLYYALLGKDLAFGSELKALRAHPAWPGGGVDPCALALYLRHGYVPSPLTIHPGVSKLPPGTFLTVRPGIASLPDPVPYWSMKEAALAGMEQPFQGTEHDAADELEALLGRSVAGQMLSDVPLGAFLSGGIDSSLVTALMQARSSRPVRTFTVGFWEKEVNEAAHASAVARHLGTEHTELTVTAQDALDVVPLLPSMFDEPFADYSQIPTHLVARLTRGHVTVSLSADGGDEFFGGYRTYFYTRALWERSGMLPPQARRAFGLLKLLPPRLWDALLTPLSKERAGHRIHVLAEILTAATAEELFDKLTGHWLDPSLLIRGMPRDAASVPIPALAGRPGLKQFVRRLQYRDAVTYLPDDILVKVDRAAMAVSLETRAPLLDHRIVEFAWRLPVGLLMRGNTGKLPLRNVLYRHVPQELVDRPKQGFTLPLDVWLRGPLREWAEALLDPARLRSQGYLHPGPIRAKWREHLKGTRDWKHLLWDVLMFQAWLETLRP